MSYIYNKNHDRSHHHGCRAIGMMNYTKNAEETEEPLGHTCGWCGAPGGPRKYPARHQNQGLDPYIGERICNDPDLIKILQENGCSCGSQTGDVRMYPHQAGITIPGEDGHWWVYFHCYECGHDTSISKVPLRVASITMGVEI